MDSSVAIVLVGASAATGNVFIYCYYGMLATESYEQMSDYLYYDLNWYDLPNKIQKYLVIMIGNIQKPIYYHGFEIAQLNLRTFIQVRNFTQTNGEFIWRTTFFGHVFQLIRKVINCYMIFKSMNL